LQGALQLGLLRAQIFALALQGTDLGGVTLNGGFATTAVALLISGPFHIYEGFLLLPSQSDILGSGGNAWSSYQNDSAVTATASADFAAHEAHLGLLASATSYAPQPTSQSTLVDVAPAVAASGGPAPATAAPTSGAPGGSVLQAEPESVSAAQSGSACLVAGSCVAPPTGSTHANGVIGLLVIGLLVGTLVALAVVVSRRRSVPPPAHPNARLYPTSAEPAVPLPAGKPPAPPAEPPSDDPLGHLW